MSLLLHVVADNVRFFVALTACVCAHNEELGSNGVVVLAPETPNPISLWEYPVDEVSVTVIISELKVPEDLAYHISASPRIPLYAKALQFGALAQVKLDVSAIPETVEKEPAGALLLTNTMIISLVEVVVSVSVLVWAVDVFVAVPSIAKAA